MNVPNRGPVVRDMTKGEYAVRRRAYRKLMSERVAAGVPADGLDALTPAQREHLMPKVVRRNIRG